MKFLLLGHTIFASRIDYFPGPIEDADWIEQGNPIGIAHVIPDKCFVDKVCRRVAEFEVQMRKNFRFGAAGVGNGRDDIAFCYRTTRFYMVERFCMCVYGYPPAGFAWFSVMFDHQRLAKVFVKQGSKHAVVHRRRAGLLIETDNVPEIVPVKTKTDALMREITPTKISPPFVG